MSLLLAQNGAWPDILIEREAKTLAVLDETTGHYTAPDGRSGRYSLEKWRETFRRPVPRDRRPSEKSRRFRCDPLGCVTRVKGKMVIYVKHPAAISDDCRVADILVARFPLRRLRDACAGPRVVIDRFDVARAGAHALYMEGQSIRIETVAQIRGTRPWTEGHKVRGEPSYKTRKRLPSPPVKRQQDQPDEENSPADGPIGQAIAGELE